MNNEQQQLHSAEHFVESRDYWWNRDFLALMARRWRLEEVRTVLDVGCGVGHWGRALVPHLPRLELLTGVDREPEWARQAQTNARGFPARCLVGDALALPFPDASFDMVTCQTLLIHVSDPAAAIREFLRVLKPGGLLAVVEPNNLANATVRANIDADESIEERVEMLRFQMMCQRGKTLLREGDISAGDLIPGLFVEAGAQDAQVYLSDKACPLLPPYDSPEQSAIVQEIGERWAREEWMWDRAKTWRFFAAAGGTESEFTRLWAKAGEGLGEIARACRAQRYTSGGGVMSYLVSGRKAAR